LALPAVLLCASAAVLLLGPVPVPVASAQTAVATANDQKGGRKSEADAYRDPLRDGQSTQNGISSGDKVRVLVRSYQTAAIAAEINARITRLPEREGDRFHKGDVIIEFDCRKIITEHRAALAIYHAHKASYENQRQMLRYSAAGTLAVDQARFEMEKALADVDGFDVKRLSCTVHAPFDGRVTEKTTQVHEIAQPNQPLIRIINESKLELVLMVPSAWLSRVKGASTFSVKIDETGETHEARIVQSTGLIDPVSQSARYIAELLAPSSTVLPGMSGTATFARRKGSQ
jgi:membrane fusion protein, multidrug efflux system